MEQNPNWFALGSSNPDANSSLAGCDIIAKKAKSKSQQSFPLIGLQDVKSAQKKACDPALNYTSVLHLTWICLLAPHKSHTEWTQLRKIKQTQNKSLSLSLCAEKAEVALAALWVQPFRLEIRTCFKFDAPIWKLCTQVCVNVTLQTALWKSVCT